MKRIAAIHDLSGFGKSSLTVVIPVLSSFGMQVCPVPTAILSTQTDGFYNWSYNDLTPSLPRYLNHWGELGLVFDCVYTGYLGSSDQVNIIRPFVEKQKDNGAIILIDPVLGDNEALYQGISDKMVKDMKSFISSAQIITPNYTESFYLLDEASQEFKDVKQTEEYVRRFSKITDANVIITSVRIAERYYNVCFDRKIDDVFNIEFENQQVSYPGAGDAFASILLGKLLQTDDFTLASFFATNRTSYMVKKSIEQNSEPREGLPIENYLYTLNNDEIF